MVPVSLRMERQRPPQRPDRSAPAVLAQQLWDIVAFHSCQISQEDFLPRHMSSRKIRFCCMQMQCKLTVVLVIACLFMILEFAGGLIANRCLHSSPDFHLLHSCAEFFAHQDGV